MTMFYLLKIRTSIDIFRTEKCKVTFGLKYTFIHCSQVTVVHVHEKTNNKFSLIHPARHNDANGIKPGSTLKMTDKHSAENKNKCVIGLKLICV